MVERPWSSWKGRSYLESLFERQIADRFIVQIIVHSLIEGAPSGRSKGCSHAGSGNCRQLEDDKTAEEAVETVNELKPLVDKVKDREVVICARPFTALADLVRATEGSNIAVGAPGRVLGRGRGIHR